ncbi:TraB/GumN family protein [Flavobacterium sp. RHBU_24]|uniref:TraB/GumN family protein n=1 Tax=Flavobacterium sp. RHBU_24 TaxID=3391185 RepID=UPI0039850ECD
MKKIIFAVSTLLISAIGFSQKLDNALLWKISGNGLIKPSYLFGTMHITCDATLEANVLAALDATGQLYLEVKMDDPALQAKMMQGALMKDGQKMSQLAAPEDFELVNKFLNENIGMPATLLDAFKPGLISMMIVPKALDCPAESVEMNLMSISTEQGEEMFGLETIEYQLAIFDAIPYKEQMDELVKMAKEGMGEQIKANKELNAIYKSKDLNAISDYIAKEDEIAHSDIMLEGRNKNWIPTIEEAAKAKATFFGIGAAHLAGDKGVIMLLRKKGYKVEAVK